MYSYWPLHCERVAGRQRHYLEPPSAAPRPRSCRCRGPPRRRTPTPWGARPRSAPPSGRPSGGSSRPAQAARPPAAGRARRTRTLVTPSPYRRPSLGRTEAVCHGHEHRGEPLRRVAQLLRIPDPHPVALPSLDRLRDRHPADGRGDHRLHVAHVEAVACGRRPVDVDVQVVARHGALGEGAARARYHPDGAARPRGRAAPARPGPARRA